jgi:crotonobetainyl-CoA:carnitine CoA-transferase CaiB-like acyl-CoA transferase
LGFETANGEAVKLSEDTTTNTIEREATYASDAARNSFVEVDHPVAGRYKVPNFPVKFSATPGEVKTAAPVLGQHTEDVLKKLLKKTPQEIEALEKTGAIVCWRG